MAEKKKERRHYYLQGIKKWKVPERIRRRKQRDLLNFMAAMDSWNWVVVDWTKCCMRCHIYIKQVREGWGGKTEFERNSVLNDDAVAWKEMISLVQKFGQFSLVWLYSIAFCFQTNYLLELEFESFIVLIFLTIIHYKHLQLSLINFPLQEFTILSFTNIIFNIS